MKRRKTEKPMLTVPSYIQQIAETLMRQRKEKDRKVFLSELASGLIHPDKWQDKWKVEDDKYLQF